MPKKRDWLTDARQYAAGMATLLMFTIAIVAVALVISILVSRWS